MVREKIGNELVRVKKEATDEAVNTALAVQRKYDNRRGL